jgi:hypothetical protein
MCSLYLWMTSRRTNVHNFPFREVSPTRIRIDQVFHLVAEAHIVAQ